MGVFKTEKTDIELYIEEKFSEEEEILYNFDVEIEEDNFIEVKIETGEANGDNIQTGEQLPPKPRGWISSRAEFLFNILERSRFEKVQRVLRFIRKRL
jgi:hypothetical protein